MYMKRNEMNACMWCDGVASFELGVGTRRERSLEWFLAKEKGKEKEEREEEEEKIA